MSRACGAAPLGSQWRSDDDAGQAGFTLVELLVALSLLSLMAVFIGEGVFSVRTMVPVAARLDAGMEIAAVRDHLRDTIGGAVTNLPANESEALVGEPSAMRFFAAADPVLEIGGLNRITIGIESGPGPRLDLVERRALARGTETGVGSANVLLRGIETLSIRYAAPPEKGSLVWRSEWVETGLPALISLEVGLPPGDRRQIRPLLIHPMVDQNTGTMSGASGSGEKRNPATAAPRK